MNPKSNLYQFIIFAFKVIIAHTITYFIFGLLMSNIFDYHTIWNEEVINTFMRPMDSPWIMIGPFLQPIRGLLFAIGIWPIRDFLLNKKYGWVILWNIIVVFGILSTPAAAPCSVEGLLYTQLPLWFHLIGLPEILLQTLAFSLLLFKWMKPTPKNVNEKKINNYSKMLLTALFSVMIACFGYIGYALGGILTAKLAGATIKLSGASINFKGQLMFVFAFLINTISLVFLIFKNYYNKLPTWLIFLLFWLIDTFSPLLYQFLTNRMMPLHMAIFMGIFPAIIITISIKFNSSKLEKLQFRNS